MRSDFATARHHLEHAHNCLSGGGDDDLTQKMLMALSLLIEAALTAEHTANEASKVVPFPPVGRGRLRPSKKPFGNRDGNPPS